MGTALVVYNPDQQTQTRHAGGRPTKYDEWIVTRICNTLARGVTRQAAYLDAGITHETFHCWLNDNEEFSERVARAEAEAEVALTNTVFAAGTDGATKGDYKASIEWLKRRRRADYGDTLDIRKVDAAQLLQMLQQQAENGTQSDTRAIEDSFDVL